MINRVEVHNRLSGCRFVAVEFAAIAMASSPFGIYWIAHRDWLLATIALGIAANSLLVFKDCPAQSYARRARCRVLEGSIRTRRSDGPWPPSTRTFRPIPQS